MFGRLVRLFRSLVNLRDSPHGIALGTAVGLFIAWTPTVGLHMVLVVAAALVLRANKIAALIAVYISNPLTIVPMYWIDYKVGALVLHQEFTYEEMRELLHYNGWSGLWAAIWKLCVELAGPMWLGGLVLAVVHAVPGYFVTRRILERYRSEHASANVEPVGASSQGDSTTAPPPLSPE